jgi:tetratricopeptide (TPR) repeat protein
MPTVEEVGPAMDDTFDLDRSLPQPNAEEQAALAEPGDLDEDDRRTILAMSRRLGWGDAWGALGLPPNAEKRRVKRAYFKLSKEFHPDRYFGKKLGTFAGRLERIFEALSKAYTELTETRARTGETGKLARNPGEAQSPIEYAAELYDRACQTELHGDPLEAMKQFAAAIRIDPQVKYLRRAARCALTAGQPRSAEEYANKAANLEPNDASTSRLLASAFRAQNKLEAAEEVLIMALAVPSENDALVQELRRDLADIRRAMGTGSAR